MATSLGKEHDLYGYMMAPPPYPVHLVRDLIVKEGTYGMLFGEASSAKSLIMQGLVLALASGEAFAGEFEVKGGSRNVLFLDLDQGADTSLRRFGKLANWPEFDEDWKAMVSERIFHYSPWHWSMMQDEHVKDLYKALQVNQIDVLVIDCLARTLGGMEENETRTANEYFLRVKNLQEKSLEESRPLTVVVLHHSRKAALMQGGGKLPPHDDMRGASAWRDSLDFQIRAWKKGDVVGLTKLKDRNSEVPEGKFMLRLHDRVDDAGTPVGVRFEFEPDADVKDQSVVLLEALRRVTGGEAERGVGIKRLADVLKAEMVKGVPHSPLGIRKPLLLLCKQGEVLCSNSDAEARDPHKRFWSR